MNAKQLDHIASHNLRSSLYTILRFTRLIQVNLHDSQISPQVLEDLNAIETICLSATLANMPFNVDGRNRYHLITCGNDNEVVILDSETGAIQHPRCWQDISAYYAYLMNSGKTAAAQTLLAESMSGSKPITRLVQSFKPGTPQE
jgi:hypothetical protein